MSTETGIRYTIQECDAVLSIGGSKIWRDIWAGYTLKAARETLRTFHVYCFRRDRFRILKTTIRVVK